MYVVDMMGYRSWNLCNFCVLIVWCLFIVNLKYIICDFCKILGYVISVWFFLYVINFEVGMVIE